MEYSIKVKELLVSENTMTLTIMGYIADPTINSHFLSNPKLVLHFINKKEDRRIPFVLSNVTHIDGKCFFSGRYNYRLDLLFWKTRAQCLPFEMYLNLGFADYYEEKIPVDLTAELTELDNRNYQVKTEGNKLSFIPDKKRIYHTPAARFFVTLCSGYDSQAIAMDMLRERYPDFRWELKAWSEFDPESNRPLAEQPAVVAHNLLFPQYKDLNRGDMTKADWSDLKDAEIDLLTYSTPCQSISQAGKREGIKKGSGTRSAVLWSTEDAVKTMRPKVLLQENVRALINSVNMPDFKEWCQLLESHGYVNFLAPSFPTPWGTDKRDRHTIPGILNAKHYGVPQNRERVYMVSIRADLLGNTQYEFPRPFPLDRCIADILEDDVDERFFLKPDSVIKFLTVNEASDADQIRFTLARDRLTKAACTRCHISYNEKNTERSGTAMR